MVDLTVQLRIEMRFFRISPVDVIHNLLWSHSLFILSDFGMMKQR